MLTITTIALLLTGGYVLIFFFYLAGWTSAREFHCTKRIPATRVSIVIAARNEAENIGSLLRDLLEQQYPLDLFELIVVDDFSQDETVQAVNAFHHASIRLIQLGETGEGGCSQKGSKKKALESGIESARGELIITTDADCRMNPFWLATMVNYYEETQCTMIAAPVLISEEENFLQAFQALDLIGMMGITCGTMQMNFPVMCNGANLAFTKKAFHEVNGYQGIDRRASGDDMLLMHKIVKRVGNHVRFLKHHQAIVCTQAEKTWRSFFIQRMRWTSKSADYTDWRIRFNLLWVYLFNLSLPVMAIAAIRDPVLLWLLIPQVTAKWIMDFVLLSQTASWFRRSRLLWLFLPAEICHTLYVIVVGFAGNFFKVQWKGRTAK